jgi:hypothetical protein
MFLPSALDGYEWSASLPACFTTWERPPGIHLIGGWLGTREDEIMAGESQCSSGIIEIKVRAGRPGFSSRQEQLWNFFLVTASSLTSGPTQLPIQGIPGALMWR